MLKKAQEGGKKKPAKNDSKTKVVGPHIWNGCALKPSTGIQGTWGMAQENLKAYL